MGRVSIPPRMSQACLNPLRKRLMVSSLPTVYPDRFARSLKSVIYWSMSGNLNCSFFSRCLECWVFVESVNCSSNVAVKCSHTCGMLSLMGSRFQSQVVISRTHQSMWGPLISVRVRATCQMGNLNLGTLVFSSRYPSSLFIKVSTLSLSPLKMWGSIPTTHISAASGTGTSCCRGIGAGCPLLPPPSSLPPPPPPSLPSPPPGGAPGPVLHRAAARAFLRWSSTPGWPPPLGAVAGAAGAAVGAAAAGAEVEAAMAGVVWVEVVAMVAVVEPMFFCCGIRTATKVLYCLVGVIRGTQGSWSSLYGLPRPSGSITTDVFQRLLCGSGLSSSSSSGSSLLLANSSARGVSMSVACTSPQKGPRKGLLVFQS